MALARSVPVGIFRLFFWGSLAEAERPTKLGEASTFTPERRGGVAQSRRGAQTEDLRETVRRAPAFTPKRRAGVAQSCRGTPNGELRCPFNSCARREACREACFKYPSKGRVESCLKKRNARRGWGASTFTPERNGIVSPAAAEVEPGPGPLGSAQKKRR